jgi:hypothetical protein
MKMPGEDARGHHDTGTGEKKAERYEGSLTD